MLGSLRHGVFNLGFLALAKYGEGVMFLDWWAKRCLDWCYDDAPKGLFTDQRWIDLAPCFFRTLHVLQHPGYNMATWNLYYRKLGRNSTGNLTVNDEVPLRFFHFSGFDIGTHELMLKKHAKGDALLTDITNWYVSEQDLYGQKALGKRPGVYEFFGSGEYIERNLRVTYRENSDLVERFPFPYSQPELEKWAITITYEHASPTLVGKIASRVSKNQSLVIWLNKNLPNKVRGWLRRRI